MTNPIRGRRRVAIVVIAVLLIVGFLVVRSRATAPSQAVGAPEPFCQTTPVLGAPYRLNLEQAKNATTIAAVGKRMGLADHAITIALATAFQESQLLNLDHGDRDSLGLFQQRPSQGWGTPEQIMDPSYAAAAFYRELAKVPKWQTISVTEAAQAVQRSAAPMAYADGEAASRALAQAATGEVAAGFACRFDPVDVDARVDDAAAALHDQLGGPGVGEDVSAAQGWTMTTWLIAHALEYGLTDVSFAGQHWTPQSGAWTPTPGATARPPTTDLRVRIA